MRVRSTVECNETNQNLFNIWRGLNVTKIFGESSEIDAESVRVKILEFLLFR